MRSALSAVCSAKRSAQATGFGVRTCASSAAAAASSTPTISSVCSRR